MSKYYNKKGKPIDLAIWAELFQNPKYQIIHQEKINNYYISTIWTGLDNVPESKPPYIFETIVFSNKKFAGQEETKHYTSEKDAIKGHKALCKKFKKN